MGRAAGWVGMAIWVVRVEDWEELVAMGEEQEGRGWWVDTENWAASVER